MGLALLNHRDQIERIIYIVVRALVYFQFRSGDHGGSDGMTSVEAAERRNEMGWDLERQGRDYPAPKYSQGPRIIPRSIVNSFLNLTFLIQLMRATAGMLLYILLFQPYQDGRVSRVLSFDNKAEMHFPSSLFLALLSTVVNAFPTNFPTNSLNSKL